jgi:hypothetical protein
VVSKRRLDDRDIRRRAPTRQPKRRLLIVCEGRETEPGYIRAFQREVRNPRVEIRIEKKNTPLRLVERAVRLKEEAQEDAVRQRDENLRWDEVWGVFDIDEHAHLDEARKLAQTHGIDLAVSNPCFELWALLHFQDQRGHIERQRARAALQRHLPGYDKTINSSSFSKLYESYDLALKRAKALDREAKRHNAPGRNPTTGVYRLTESIKREGSP